MGNFWRLSAIILALVAHSPAIAQIGPGGGGGGGGGTPTNPNLIDCSTISNILCGLINSPSLGIAGTTPTTQTQVLTGATSKIQTDLNGNLYIAPSQLAPQISNAGSAVATTSTNIPAISYLYGFNGTTYDQLQVDGSKNLKVVGSANATTNITQWNSVALGSPSNYGTSPGAVEVPGVNAFVTNSVTLGQTTKSASLPVAIASDQVGTAGTPNATVTTVQGAAGMTPLAVNGQGPGAVSAAAPVVFSSQYPVNAVTTTPTAVTATGTGTTAATTATLAATASVTNYVCGFSITADATALAVGTATLSGTISGSLNYLQNILAATAGVGLLQQNFNPCIPASAANTAITMTSAAAGTGGNTIVNIWGYRL